MHYVNGFRCIDCLTLHPSASYTCAQCGGNLEIEYDMSAVRAALAQASLRDNPRQDIWRYQPLLPVKDLSKIPPLRIGGTPLYYSRRIGPQWGLNALYLKDDTHNPSASFKDRASALALVNARENGVTRITGASTGNAGSSMACLAASVGMQAVIFVPHTAPRAKIAQLLTFGARVMAVRGSYDDAFDLCLKVSQEYGWYNRNTGFNPYTREGKKTCALEIVEQLGGNSPDRVFVPVGDGNIISGIWKGFRDAHAAGLTARLPRLVAVQSTQSNAIAQTIAKLRQQPDPQITDALAKGQPIPGHGITITPVQATTLADSIAVDMPRDGRAAVKAVLESGGEAVEVCDEEILIVLRELARSEGIFAEPAGAAALAGLKQLVARQKIAADEKIVCLITGNGLKDVEAAMQLAGDPELVEPDLADVRRLFDGS